MGNSSQVQPPPPVIWGLDWPWLLIGGSILFLVVSAGFIYRKFTQPQRPAWPSIFRDYWPIIAAFCTLAVVAVALGIAVDFVSGGARTVALEGVFGALIDDLMVFSLLGFMLLLVQRREADRARNLDDKIELLFDAKQLRSGEVAYLRDQVRKVSADCRKNVTEIDIVGHDAANEIVQMDVSRRFEVANYLASETAEYRFGLSMTPDDACGNEPCVYVYPSMTTPLLPDGNGGFEPAADEIIDQGGELKTGDVYRTEPKTFEIAPGQMREFRTRFRGWQRLFKPAEVVPKDGTTAPREADAYEILVLKHWDEIAIEVRNSLKSKIRVTIYGRESRSFELHPGDQQLKGYRVENLAANSSIYVSFAVP